MAECSEIEAGGEVRTIKDATARNGVAANAADIATIKARIGDSYTVVSRNNTLPSQQNTTVRVHFNNLPKGKYLPFLTISNNNATAGEVYEYTGFNGIFKFGWSSTQTYPNIDFKTTNGGAYNYDLILKQTLSSAVSTVDITLTMLCVGLID